jgi:peroxiredoxin
MTTSGEIVDAPEKINPITAGQVIPPISLKTLDGQQFDLNAFIAGKPTVLIFYRGGWCHYCNLQLAGLQKIEPELINSGFQIIAVSPDRPEKLNESVVKHELTYRLLSDNEMTAATALGIAFHLDDAMVATYKTNTKSISKPIRDRRIICCRYRQCLSSAGMA